MERRRTPGPLGPSRPAALAGLVVLLLATGLAAQEKVRLGRGRPKHRVRRNYLLPDGAKAVEKPDVRRARVDRKETLFFDVDGNGKFDDVGVDGWALSQMRFMLPFESQVVIGLSVCTWRIEGDFVAWGKEPIPLDAGQRKTLIQFNTWRWLNGLPAVTIDPALSAGCKKHCDYMEKNRFEHVEVEGRVGYTEEGAAAGLRSCLGQDGPGMSVLMFYSSFYHRLPLMRPDTRAIGIGNSARFTAVDGLTSREPRAWKYPIVVPAPGSWMQPTHFARERPRPYPDSLVPGCPITLTFDRGTVTGAEAEVRLKNAKGKPLRILVSSPEDPANKKRPDNRMSICVIPTLPLLPARVYWVKVMYKLDGKPRDHEWVFKTGPRRPVAKPR